MARISHRRKLIRSYLAHIDSRLPLYIILKLISSNPIHSVLLFSFLTNVDTTTFYSLIHARYLTSRLAVPKAGNLHLTFYYARHERDHHRFIQLVRMTPESFRYILSRIKHHSVFEYNPKRPQKPVKNQLVVALYRLGRYGNGASVKDIARNAGISEGAVVEYTDRCIQAILALETEAMQKPTAAEVAREKAWVRERTGCYEMGDGWCTGDGTLVNLFQKPALNGDAYFSCKMTYSLNVQIINLFTNLRIIEYVAGFTGSTHDSAAFQHSAVVKHPDWFFGPNEFMWADSAYALTPRVIPVHKKPEADVPCNRRFDKAVSNIRIRSEHCMGALKGRWQSLRGLRIPIQRKHDHVSACNWIRACIVLHNLVVEMEGEEWSEHWRTTVGDDSDVDDGAPEVPTAASMRQAGNTKRKYLVQAYANAHPRGDDD